jgi:glycosyltransferase involved in cell wall biosynthesis
VSPRRLIYLSQGNIPSRWAHTFQAMRMASAFSRLVDEFELVTQVHWLRRLLPAPDFAEWYGLREPFRVVRLVTPGAPHRASFRHDRYPAFDRRAAAYACRRSPDLVFTRSLNAARETTRRGLPTLVETHSSLDHPDFESLLSTVKSQSFRGLVTISEALAEDYVRAGIAEDSILVWPDAVDLEPYRDLPNRAEARAALQLPTDGPIALYAGHLYPHKGVVTVIEAAARLPEVHFVLVGGWDRDLRRLRARSEGLSNVHLMGFVPNARVPLHLAAADVLLLPNSGQHEQARVTSPLKLFEYMAAGRPIVASAIPALVDRVVEGRNAALFRPDDAEDLARAIREVLEAPERAEALAREAAREVESFTWDARAREILERFGASGDP